MSLAKGAALLLLAAGLASAQFLDTERELWICPAVACSQCPLLSGRAYCSLNNQEGTCCTATDGRPGCTTSTSNCTGLGGFNLTRNFGYLVCPYIDTVCGSNPSPQDLTDPEADKRFGNNFIIARGDPITITTPIGGFTNNSRCTYVIKKSI